jgi:hypothetical protein
VPRASQIALRTQATELELMEQTLEAYLKEKSERRSSKKKRSKIEGRVQSGGRGEGQKRRKLVDALVCEEDDCFYLYTI